MFPPSTPKHIPYSMLNQLFVNVELALAGSGVSPLRPSVTRTAAAAASPILNLFNEFAPVNFARPHPECLHCACYVQGGQMKRGIRTAKVFNHGESFGYKSKHENFAGQRKFLLLFSVSHIRVNRARE
jgi:hypothetical protein